MDEWRAWIGRREDASDRLTPAMVSRLLATLDRDPEGERDHAPPLAHWLCFLPSVPQGRIDVDGHPRRGGFLPPIDLPRRMWAGGRLEFFEPLPIGIPLVRRSTILDVREKLGGTGRLAFVTMRHAVTAEGVTIVEEEQDLVFRAAAGPSPSAPASPPEVERGDVEREFVADPTLLLRFSALTFNAHRIHYDRDYARDEEGYGGLVLHGPLIATLLMHLWLEASGGRTPRRFSFRARKPLLDTAPFTLCMSAGPTGSRLWTRDQAGYTTMTAEVA